MHDPPLYNLGPGGETWTDYDGDESYSDFTVSGSTATNSRSFELGLATVDPFATNGQTNTKYYHQDLIGTTRSLSASGLPSQASVYTAFGERVSGTNHRYGYAGEWGYQAHDFPPAEPMPYLHVGARYYDPSSGRFLHRDPIGVAGGLNLYEYVASSPTSDVDPLGLWNWFEAFKWGGIGGLQGSKSGPWGAVGGTCLGFIGGGLEKKDVLRFPSALHEHLKREQSRFVPQPPPRTLERPFYCHSCPQSGTPHSHIGPQPGKPR